MSHAIVMGGSIAGMCAAAALAKKFDRVSVIERDPKPGPEARRGAPQGHHTHALLSRAQAIMSELFPGSFDALAQSGAVCRDMGTAARWFLSGAWRMPIELGIDAWFQSRPLLEFHLRECLEQNPKVELRFEVAVDEPIHENGQVTGLRLRDGSTLTADLVVDATGRGSRSSAWIEQWGYGRVPEQHVRIGLAYVSGVFEHTSSTTHASPGVAVYQYAPAGNKRLGFCFRLENNRSIVSLAGYHGDHAPTDIAGFREWAKTLLQPDLAEALNDLELVGELRKFNYREQLRRVYGEMRRLPERYLIVGDAMCSLDPTFGQGMVICAIQAELLAAAARPGGSTKQLQRELYRVTALPFSMTANEAHRWPETTGWKPRFCAAQQAYFAKVFDVATHDADVYRSLIRSMHFLAPPTELLRPKLVWRVLTSRTTVAHPTSPLSSRASS